jgi:hypothetical protein
MEAAEFGRRLAALEANTETVNSYRAELKEFLQDSGLGKLVEDTKGGLL